MPKTAMIHNIGVSVGELKKQFALQLPTVAALIYTSQAEADAEEAAEEAVELVDALLSVIIEEVST